MRIRIKCVGYEGQLWVGSKFQGEIEELEKDK